MSKINGSSSSNFFAGKKEASEPPQDVSQGRSNWSACGALDAHLRLIQLASQRKNSSYLPPPPLVGEVVLRVGEELFRLQSSREYALEHYYSLRYVQSLCSSGALPAVKLGRDWFIVSAS